MDDFFHAAAVNKYYIKGGNRIHVLRGLSLRLERGQTLSIMGASGAGKSTLLHVLGTLDTIDSGNIHYQGKNLNALEPGELATFRNEHMGFVFQAHHLLPEFSAIENVMMPGLIARKPRAVAFDLAQRALNEVGLSHRIEHKPGELSGGEQQRVALARAIVLNPPLLFADEATGNLDDRTAEEIYALLAELNQKKEVTIVLVTHNQTFADRMKRKLRLVDGELRER